MRDRPLAAAALLLAVSICAQGCRGGSQPSGGSQASSAPGDPVPSLVVHSVAFSPSGKELAAARDDGKVAVFAVASGQLLRTLTGHSERLRAVAFSHDGTLIASAGEDRAIRIWNAADGTSQRELRGDPPSPVWALAFLPSGRSLVSGSALALWDAGTGLTLVSLAPGLSSQCIAVSPDASLLAVGAGTRLRLWDLKKQLELPPIDAHSVTPAGGNTAAIRSVAFSPNGELLASGSEDNSVKLWRVADRQPVATLWHPSPQHRTDVQAVAFSPKGDLLASADVSVKLWEVPTGALQRTVAIGEGFMLEAIAFAPDGSSLAVTNGGRGVALLDPATGAVLRTLK